MRGIGWPCLAGIFLLAPALAHGGASEIACKVPPGWPEDSSVKTAAEGFKKLSSDKKPGVILLFPDKIPNSDAAGVKEHTAFKNFCAKVGADKDLVKMLNEMFVVFAGKTDGRELTGKGLNCQCMAIALLGPDGKKVNLWEAPPNTIEEFKAALMNVGSAIEAQKKADAEAKVKEKEAQKKEDEELARRQKAAAEMQKVPGMNDPAEKKDAKGKKEETKAPATTKKPAKGVPEEE